MALAPGEGREGKEGGGGEAASTPPCPALEHPFTRAFPALSSPHGARHWDAGLGAGIGHGAGLGAGVGARGRAQGRQHWQREPIAPLRRAGLSCPLGGAGFVTDGHSHPQGRSASPVGCGQRHSCPDHWEALDPTHWCHGPGGKGLFIFPARVAQGPRDPSLH